MIRLAIATAAFAALGLVLGMIATSAMARIAATLADPLAGMPF